MLICPPFTLVHAVAEAVAGTPSGRRRPGLPCAKSGAHTGDISAVMLADAGAPHVIVGHSERRAEPWRDDALVRAKAAAAHAAGLIADHLRRRDAEQREAGKALARGRTPARGLAPGRCDRRQTVIAYEPVWAIGTGKTPRRPMSPRCMPISARRSTASSASRGQRIRILYGGSVKPSNAAELLAVDNVDGALVGGASLVADDFWGIAETCR